MLYKFLAKLNVFFLNYLISIRIFNNRIRITSLFHFFIAFFTKDFSFLFLSLEEITMLVINYKDIPIAPLFVNNMDKETVIGLSVIVGAAIIGIIWYTSTGGGTPVPIDRPDSFPETPLVSDESIPKNPTGGAPTTVPEAPPTGVRHNPKKVRRKVKKVSSKPLESKSINVSWNPLIVIRSFYREVQLSYISKRIDTVRKEKEHLKALIASIDARCAMSQEICDAILDDQEEALRNYKKAVYDYEVLKKTPRQKNYKSKLQASLQRQHSWDLLVNALSAKALNEEKLYTKLEKHSKAKIAELEEAVKKYKKLLEEYKMLENSQ